MKRLLIPTLLALFGPGSALQAQQPRMGVALNLVLPSGKFNNYSGISHDDQGNPFRFNEGYDLGLGGQFTVSFPVDPKLAIRLNLSGHVVEGSNTAPGYDKINLRHTMFSVGGDLQIFTQSAYRHRGTYFIVGLAADFERFERTFGDFDDYDYYDYWHDDDIDTTRKSRLGGNFGIGHTFGLDAGVRFTLEATYHKTLNGNDSANDDPPNTDFVRLSFGCVF
jgi:hypothetical protein